LKAALQSENEPGQQERGIETAKMEPQPKYKQITDNQGEHNCGRSVRHVNHDGLKIFF
jgi:hypothetical protein